MELPHLAELSTTFEGMPVRFISLTSGADSDAAQAILAESGVTYETFFMCSDAIDAYETIGIGDADAGAEVLVVAYGITARSAQRAVKLAREKNIRAGLFRPITVWPFPEEALREAARASRAILVPEMNAGQLCLEVERVCGGGGARVERLNRIDGEVIPPGVILERLEALA